MPKALVYLGRKSILQHVLETLDCEAVARIVIVVGRYGEMVRYQVELLRSAGVLSTPTLFLEMREAETNTAGFLARHRTELGERFLLCCGDVWIPDFRLGEVASYHEEKLGSRQGVVGTLVCSGHCAIGVGVIDPGAEAGTVGGFTEKPSSGRLVANTGTGIFESRVLDYVADPMDSFFAHVVPSALGAGERFAFTLVGEWIHVQSLPDLYRHQVEQYGTWVCR